MPSPDLGEDENVFSLILQHIAFFSTIFQAFFDSNSHNNLVIFKWDTFLVPISQMRTLSQSLAIHLQQSWDWKPGLFLLSYRHY